MPGPKEDTIHSLDLTLPSAEANLALDEALLEICDAGGPEVLRTWESPHPFIVLGLSGNAEREVYREACRRDGIPILRRISGGGTVLQGPGCFNYALILRKDRDAHLSTIEGTHAYILNRMEMALKIFHPEVHRAGLTDLAIYGHKISGNAHRRLHQALLFHGTILYDFDLTQMERYLRLPDRRPLYRGDRPHGLFVRNLKTDPESLKTGLQKVWEAAIPLSGWPEEGVNALLTQRYSLSSWNLREETAAPVPAI